MSEWIEPDEVEVPAELQQLVGGNTLVAQLLARRGYTEPSAARPFLDPRLYLPSAPSLLPDLTRAAALLQAALRESRRICVWGDFDVDGQTATTLLVSALEDLGGRVRFHIPVRAKESHGVNLPVLQELLADGIDLLLTCDTGISAHEAVAYARDQGATVIITDHHDLPPTLPEAEAVVNPKRLPAGHPLRTLPGVGVAYKLVEELYRLEGRAEAADSFLDLVALGIVADLAIQTGDTRYLLQRGLQALREPRRLGLQALMESAGLSPTWLTEEHIGFVLGPRMNALGRLADANPIVEFLTTRDRSRARILAQQLEGLNAERKLLTDQVFQGAMSQLERDPSLLDHAALVLAHPRWPGGVIGIVASRLVERYHKPVVLISAPPDGPARGSARSVEGCDISAAIGAQRDLLLGFGGHPMAAGLSMAPDRIEDFRRGLSRTVEEMMGKDRPEPTLHIDAYLPLAELSLGLVQDLERLAPFGPGNPPLIFASQNLVLLSQTPLGRDGEHLRLIVEEQDQEHTQKVIWWQGAGWEVPKGRFDLAYSVRASSFRGQREVQVEWVEARPLEAPAIEIRDEAPPIEAVDYRMEAHPLTILQQLQAGGDVQVWAEGEPKEKVDGRARHELEPGKSLAIWTIPPGPEELQATLQAVSPEIVYLFAVDPDMDRVGAFLHRLAGLVKYSVSMKGGLADLADLSAATAQRESVVALGLAWMEGRGMISTTWEPRGVVRFSRSNEGFREDLGAVADWLQKTLKEVAAFRAYYRKAPAERLLAVEELEN